MSREVARRIDARWNLALFLSIDIEKHYFPVVDGIVMLFSTSVDEDLQNG